MAFVNCFDVVSMVVEEATKQFAPLWKLDKECNRILEQYCSVIDSLAEEFGGESFDVTVDDIAMTITIVMECEDITIESKTHKFYSLAQRSKALGFSVSEDGNLNVKFVFPSVWKNA